MKWLTVVSGLVAFAAGAAASVPPDLTGPEWTLTAIDGVAPLGEPPPSIAFTMTPAPDAKGAALSGYSGCNRFFGAYNLAPGAKISIEVRGMTKMACEGPRMELERSFVAALGRMTYLEWRYDRTMTMVSEDGKTRLDFKQPPLEPAN